MSPYTQVNFHHANLNRPVTLLLGTIAGFHWSEASRATHIYTTAGVFPVSETYEQVAQKLNQFPKEGTNVTK